MYSLLNYLSTHRKLAVFISACYFLLVVLPHELVGKVIERTLDIPLGRDAYNLLIVLIAGLSTLFLIYWLFRNLKNFSRKDQSLLWVLLSTDLILIVVSLFTIVVINIELIHVLQYAIMAILVFPILHNYRETLFWCSLLGALDELYQYMVLAPDKNDYFDFNDVIINLLGVALGLILIRAKGYISTKHFRSYFTSPASIAILSISLILVVGMIIGCFDVISDPEESNVLFSFIKEDKPGFWRELPPNVKFHVIRPLEGLIILSLLFNVFKNIGYKFDNNK